MHFFSSAGSVGLAAIRIWNILHQFAVSNLWDFNQSDEGTWSENQKTMAFGERPLRAIAETWKKYHIRICDYHQLSKIPTWNIWWTVPSTTKLLQFVFPHFGELPHLNWVLSSRKCALQKETTHSHKITLNYRWLIFQ